MTIQGAIAELQNLLDVDDVPFYYKGGIEKVIETIQMEMADRKTEPQTVYIEGVGHFPSYAKIVKDEPQTERNNYHRSNKVCTLELFDDDGNYIEPQTEREGE